MNRRGLSVIEVLVVLAVILLLLALFLPGVMHSREVARKTQCGNNLRQLGTALGNYESTHNRFPYLQDHGQSFLVDLLPFLDEQALYDIERREYDDGVLTQERTLHGTKLPVLICPSDPACDIPTIGATSYRANAGTGAKWHGYNGLFVPSSNAVSDRLIVRTVRVADVKDGLSNTAALSEGLTSDGSDDWRRIIWAIPKSLDDEEAFCRHCAEQPREGGYLWAINWHLGHPWAFTVGSNWYNHLLPPNGRNCSREGWIWSGALSAGSQHAGGAHTLFADGHVDFVSDSIDADVWRNYGSRSAEIMLKD